MFSCLFLVLNCKNFEQVPCSTFNLVKYFGFIAAVLIKKFSSLGKSQSLSEHRHDKVKCKTKIYLE